MSKIIYNNQFYGKNEFSISLENRAFLYGDGLFESVKVFNGRAFNLDAHLNRMFNGAKFLNLKLRINKEDIQNQINLLLKENSISDTGYLKIIIFRNEGGKYFPINNQSSYLIIAEKERQEQFKLNEKGIELGLFSAQLKPMSKLSNFKTISALQSILCANESKKKGKDDCLMLNSQNNIIESANSNLFYVKEGVIYTPKISEGCVDGAMRNLIINLKQLTFQIQETKVELKQLLNADEVFLTNSIQGVRWVSSIEDSVFEQQMVAQKLVNQINELI